MNIEEVQEQEKLISENYEILFTNVCDFEKKHYIGKVESKVCRFCREREPNVTFDTVAHAIPECLGNNKVICSNECDSCNKFFSKYIEDHLDKITLPFRTMNMIKGKKKVPTYITQDRKNRFEVINRETRFMKIEVRDDSNFITIDNDKKTIKMEYDLQSHIPAAAYKALVKMALSIMPNNEVNNYQNMNKWIQEKDHTRACMTPLKVFLTFVPGINPFKKTAIFLFKRKNSDLKYPECMFVLAFGNVMYQVVVPSDNEIKEKVTTKTILKLLSPFQIDWKLGEVGHKILDWSETTTIKAQKQSVNFSYNEMQKLNPKDI